MFGLISRLNLARWLCRLRRRRNRAAAEPQPNGVPSSSAVVSPRRSCAQQMNVIKSQSSSSGSRACSGALLQNKGMASNHAPSGTATNNGIADDPEERRFWIEKTKSQVGTDHAASRAWGAATMSPGPAPRTPQQVLQGMY